MKRILYTASIAKHITTFHIPYIKWLKESGCEVHVACNYTGFNDPIPYVDKQWDIPFEREPFNFKNYAAYKKIKKVIDENNYDLIHCHTPMASVITRIAAIKARKNKTIVLYTAHGLHFYKNAPIQNWLIFYPVEQILSYFTDCLITINEEDYCLVKNKFWCKLTYKIPGIGINKDRFSVINEIEKQALRRKHSYADSDFILIYVAEYTYTKNHEFIIKLIPEIQRSIPNIKILFAGRGLLLEECKSIALKYNVTKYIDFLGWRSDLSDFVSLSDIGISSSRSEGLGIGIAEEMLTALPVVASRNRGHCELIDHDKNGYLFEQHNAASFIHYIKELYLSKEKRKAFGESGKIKAEKFLLPKSMACMQDIYKQYL
jgi:glycosyltransferase EpsD